MFGYLEQSCGVISPGGMRVCSMGTVCECLGVTYIPPYPTDVSIPKNCIGICHSCREFVRCANWEENAGFVEPIENLTVCHMVYKTEPNVKGRCYAHIATKENNSNICKEVEGTELENVTLNEWYENVTINYCYRYFAESLNESLTCFKINLDFIRDECLKSVARISGDISLCENIGDLEDKNLCYISVASKLKNITLCEKIQKLSYKDSCYHGVARALKDPSICEKITYKPDWRDFCIKSAS